MQVISADTGVIMWDSGKVASNRSSQIAYAGKNLTAYGAYKWTVQWWFQGLNAEVPVTNSTFEMGPITRDDWKGASWLNGPRLKADFALPVRSGAKMLRARAYFAVPGGHTLEVNGKACGDQIGVSAWLRFDKSVLYQAHDLTDLLVPGSNSLQIFLGTGFTSNTAVLGKVVAFYSDGHRFELSTTAGGNGWQQSFSPFGADTHSNDPFSGTTTHWPLTLADWKPAEAASQPPAGEIRALAIPAAGVLRTVSPTNITKLSNGHLRFDFPENFVGVLKLKLSQAPSGDASAITLKHGEVLLSNGSVSFPWHENFQTDRHILSKDVPAGTWLMPRFTWHGFQHVEVAADNDSGFDGKLSSVVGLVVGPTIEKTGSVTFDGGHEAKMLNAIQGLVVNSQLSNVAGYIPTDCPTREKHGWLGDAQVTAEEAMFNFDMAQIYTNFLQMIEDDQESSKHKGDVPGVVPSNRDPHLTSDRDLLHTSNRDPSGITDISWSAAYPLIARWVLRYYGDLRLVARHWKSMKAFVDQLTGYASSHCTGGLADYWTWGDWCAVDSRAEATPTTGPELSAFNYILALDAMAEMAVALAADPEFNEPGAAEDATNYAALARKFRPVFHKRFFNESVNAYGPCELELQSLTVAPLALGGVVPDAKLAAVVNSLSEDIKRNNNHFTVGSVGAKHLFPQLTAYGLHDQAMAVATQTTYPSFGHWLENGATTCWEDYSGVADESHPPPPTRNHIFLCGGVGEWMYRSVAGISPASDGYDKITIAPQIGHGVATSTAHVKTVRGVALVSWAASANHSSYALAARVPVSSSASISFTSLPLSLTPSDVVVRESGTLVWENGAFKQGAVPGVLAGKAVGKLGIEFEVVSGSYSFHVDKQIAVFV